MCRALRWLVLFGSVVLFTACGGGGGGEGANPVNSGEMGPDITDSGDAVPAGTEIAINADVPNSDRNQIDESTGFKRPVLELLWSDDIAMGEGRVIDSTIMFSGVSEANQVVELWLNDRLAGSALANGIGEWRFDYRTVQLTVGHYFARLVSKSKEGVRTASANSFHFVYDPSIPDAPLIEGVADDSYVSGDAYTSDNTLSISGSADFGLTVRVFLDGVEIGSTRADDNNRWVLDYSSVILPDNNYQITARAEILNLVSTVSQPFDLSVDTSDPLPPVLSGITPDSGASASDLITNQAAVFISGNTEPLADVTIRLNGIVVGNTAANASGFWTYDLSSLALVDGSHPLAMQATDRAGNQSVWSNDVILVIDSVTPANTSNLYLSPDTGTVGDAITSVSRLSFGGMAEPNASVELFVNGNPIGSIAADGVGAWRFDYSGISLVDGNHLLASAVTDMAGNRSNVVNSLVFTVDSSPPAVPTNFSFSVDSGILGDGITNDNQLTISGTSDANVSVEVFLGGSAIGTATADGSGNWSYNHTAILADASYVVTAIARDAAGNESSVSSDFIFSVDTTAPTVSNFTPSQGGSNVGLSDDLIVAFDETVAIASGNIALRLTADDSVVETIDVSSGQVAGGGTSSITINPINRLYGSTQYYVVMDASSFTDVAGNGFAGISAKSTWAFTTEDTVISSTSPADGETGVAINTSITLNFNEAVYAASGNVLIRQVSDNSPVETINIASDQVTGSGSSSIVISLSNTLSPTTEYYVELASGALENGAGVGFAGISGNSTLNFTTRAVSTPSVVNVTTTVADGTYGANETIPIQVVFDEAVYVTGYPTLDIDLDDPNKTIFYSSGNGTTTLQFDYVVAVGDTKTGLSVVSTTSLSLNGATIRGLDFGDANLTLPSANAINSLEYNHNITIAAKKMDISTLTSADGFFIEGYEAGDFFGRAVSSGGDVNGDGYEDLVIGHDEHDVGSSNDVGIAYVIYGGSSLSDISINAFSASDGFTIVGSASGDLLGSSVHIGGDLNGDGYDEIIVANPGYNSNTGRIFVFWGGPSLTNINISSFTSSDGFIINGYESGDLLGQHNGEYLDSYQFFDSNGDFNVDGIDDLLIGHANSDENATDSGVAYVIFGQSGNIRTDITLNNIGTQGFTITTNAGEEAFFGNSVQFLDDYNGDGYNDILIGSPDEPNVNYLPESLNNEPGRAHVIFGHGGSTFNDINVDSMSDTEGFTIQVSDNNLWLGASVGAADVNGDGLTDLLITHPGDEPTLTDYESKGSMAVIYGKVASSYSTVSYAAITGSVGFKIIGEAALDYLGHGVEGIKDINGDGIGDILVTTEKDSEGDTDSGSAWIIFGKAGTSRSPISLSSLTTDNGFKIIGDAANDYFGKGLAAGDLNGDGYEDVIISSPQGSNAGPNTGEVHVIWGKDFRALVDKGDIGDSGANNLVGTDGDDTLRGNGGADNITAGAGDDIIDVSDLSFSRVDGGRGTDTLVLSGSGLSYDLRNVYSHKIDGIEIIDLGNHGNSLTLDSLGLLMLSDEVRTLYVKGGANDTVTTDSGESWSATGTSVVGSTVYNRYDFNEISLYVEDGITIN